MKKAVLIGCICLGWMVTGLSGQEPIEVGFLWHMHQPTYRPGQTIFETESSGAFSFSIVDVHNQRLGPYTGWPRDAMQAGLGLPNLGASVSFSGSLIRNLNDLEAAGINGGQWNNWDGPYRQAGGWQTVEGNPRLDLVNFGFNHPLMPLLDKRDIEMQIRLQKRIHEQTFTGVPFSKGIFPPETAFSTRIIPARAGKRRDRVGHCGFNSYRESHTGLPTQQHVWVGNGTVNNGGERIVLDPDPPQAGENVTIEYDAAGGPLSGASQVYLHYGINNWSTVYDVASMSFNSELQVWTAEVPVANTAEVLDFVFNDGAGTWDNNSGQDWHYSVEGAEPAFEMDGQLDAASELIAANNGQRLYFALSQSQQLYLATDDAGEGADVFIYVAQSPGEMTPANWAKSGNIAAWDGFLADENDNDYHSWFDISGTSATGANGGMLEGVIDLQANFGTVPNSIWVAVGVFETADGGALRPQFQVPDSTDGDGNIQISEWVEINLQTQATLPAGSFELEIGELVSGGLPELAASDDQRLVAVPGVGSRVHALISSTSPIAAPLSLELTIESSYFLTFRRRAFQSVDLFNFMADDWEELHVGFASRPFDEVITVSPEGDLSRFVQPGTNRIEARCRYKGPIFGNFMVRFDHVYWTVGQ